MKQKSNRVSVKNTNTIPVIQSLGRLYKKKIAEATIPKASLPSHHMCQYLVLIEAPIKYSKLFFILHITS